MANIKYTEKELIQKLQEAHKEMKHFTGRKFDNSDKYPSKQTYEYRFGTWKNACFKANIDVTRDYQPDKKILEDVEQFIRDHGVYGYNKISEFKDRFCSETEYGFGRTMMGQVVRKLAEQELEGLNIRVSTRNMFVNNKDAGYKKKVQQIRNSYDGLKKWLFEKSLSLGKTLNGLQAAIHYLTSNDTQRETSEKFGVIVITIRHIIQDMEEEGFFDCEKGREFVKKFDCERETSF